MTLETLYVLLSVPGLIAAYVLCSLGWRDLPTSWRGLTYTPRHRIPATQRLRLYVAEWAAVTGVRS